MSLRKIVAGSAVIVLVALGPSAHAAFTFTGGGYCSGSGLLGDLDATGGVSESDMTLNGADASDCFGVVEGSGGNVESGAVAINSLWGTDLNGTDWIKDDVGGSATRTFLGMEWTLAADNGSNDSTYTLTVVDVNGTGNDPDLPITTDIVAYLKGGNSSDTDQKKAGAFFLFNDVEINATNGGTFQISWTTGGSANGPGLSGMTLLFGSADGVGPPTGGVPEPGTLALLGLPMLGLLVARRRRGHKQA